MWQTWESLVFSEHLLMLLSSSAWAAVAKYHRLRDLNERPSLSSSGGSEIMMPANSGSGEGTLPAGGQLCSHCVHMWPPSCESVEGEGEGETFPSLTLLTRSLILSQRPTFVT